MWSQCANDITLQHSRPCGRHNLHHPWVPIHRIIPSGHVVFPAKLNTRIEVINLNCALGLWPTKHLNPRPMRMVKTRAPNVIITDQHSQYKFHFDTGVLRVHFGPILLYQCQTRP